MAALATGAGAPLGVALIGVGGFVWYMGRRLQKQSAAGQAQEQSRPRAVQSDRMAVVREEGDARPELSSSPREAATLEQSAVRRQSHTAVTQEQALNSEAVSAVVNSLIQLAAEELSRRAGQESPPLADSNRAEQSTTSVMREVSAVGHESMLLGSGRSSVSSEWLLDNTQRGDEWAPSAQFLVPSDTSFDFGWQPKPGPTTQPTGPEAQRPSEHRNPVRRRSPGRPSR
ncbi:hypothetical protein [Streptomyces sp. NPDC006285]|uniref:hypothetical protein n=1 Tax=Streptomyces sp. NPDC006285 TaxID=3364742 RepID=UPI0036A13EC3